MHKKEYQSKISFRFRRWSRKSYSVFCSLGKCITIGNLRKDAIEASLKKKPGHHRIPLIAEQNAYEEEFPETGFKDRSLAALPAGFLPEICLFSLPQTADTTFSNNRDNRQYQTGEHTYTCMFPGFFITE